MSGLPRPVPAEGTPHDQSDAASCADVLPPGSSGHVLHNSSASHDRWPGLRILFSWLPILLGAKAAMDELWIWSISVIGSIGAVVLLFLWHWASAPYRSEKEINIGLNRRLVELEVDAARRPSFTIEVENCFYGGSIRPDTFVFAVIAIVKNVGRAPSVATDWSLSVFMDGKSLPVHYYFPKEARFAGNVKDPMYVIHDKDALRNKDDLPIPEGGLLRGHVLAIIDGSPDRARSAEAAVAAILRCRDIHGTEYSTDRVPVSGVLITGRTFVRGAGVVTDE